jgi:hypothetical protein
VLIVYRSRIVKLDVEMARIVALSGWAQTFDRRLRKDSKQRQVANKRDSTLSDPVARITQLWAVIG